MGRNIQIYQRNGKLNQLYNESIEELEKIGIDIYKIPHIGTINITISKRNNKRYGCCKQEGPYKCSKIIQVIGNKRVIRYGIFEKHYIEISPWLMELDDKIIKNTIIHELIHCIPYCNNHGKEFKRYAKYINQKLGYNIARTGNKKEDYLKSNVKYNEKEDYKYHIMCINCGQALFRKRLNKNFIQKYRCAKCNGKFKIISL